jgi:signal transduction histidine kinase
MSLRRKLFAKDAALLAVVAVMIGLCLDGLARQRAHVRASLGEIAALQLVESAQARLAAFQQDVHAGRTTDPAALADLRAAAYDLRRYKAIVGQYDAVLPPEIPGDVQALVRSRTKTVVTGVVRLVEMADPPRRERPQPTAAVDPAEISASVDQLARDVAEVLSMCNGFVRRTQAASDRDLRSATSTVAGVAAGAVLATLAASAWQHRRVTVPLDRLRAWCRRTAGGDFSVLYEPTTDREYQELGRDVNRMAAELDGFYRRLEAMVRDKSRELVRSERLASIGYLAAGVAHEINTPLNVMSGYAELSLKRLGRATATAAGAPTGGPDADLVEHLTIIRGEAFRCKQITDRLLSLARGDGGAREPMSVGDAVADVATMVRGLRSMRGKQLSVAVPSSAVGLVVSGNPTEVRQVLLNLIVNAVEAVEPDGGQVTVTVGRVGGWVEVGVSDNGRGMTEQTRERAFEPFFTNKLGAGQPGTGLGLSISHAIVTDHGGSISAESDGPGRGSRFTLRLPAEGRP